MNKLVKILTIAAISFVAFATMSSQASAKVMTYDEAAHKLYDTLHKAYKEKKDITVKFQVACKDTTDVRKMGIKIENLYKKIDVFYWGTWDFGEWSADSFKYKKSKKLYTGYGWHCPILRFNGGQYFGIGTKTSLDKARKFRTYEVKFRGKNKDFRQAYDQITYEIELAKDIREYTKDMEGLDKAMGVADWISKRMNNNPDYKLEQNFIHWEELYDWKRTGVKAGAYCGDFALTFVRFAIAVGIRRVAYVAAPTHAWNAVEIDGVVRYADVWVDCEFVSPEDASKSFGYEEPVMHDEYYAALESVYRWERAEMEEFEWQEQHAAEILANVPDKETNYREYLEYYDMNKWYFTEWDREKELEKIAAKKLDAFSEQVTMRGRYVWELSRAEWFFLQYKDAVTWRGALDGDLTFNEGGAAITFAKSLI